MRVLHTSDWHLGKVLMEHSLVEDQRAALDSLLELLAADPHDLLVVAGDVFDRSIPPEEAVTLLGAFLERLRDVAPTLPVVMLAGNHDSAARLAWSAGLLRRTQVHLFGDTTRVEAPLPVRAASGEEAHVWALPFLWPGALATAERPTPTQVAAMEAAVDAIRARRAEGPLQVLAAHCFAQGGATSESERTLVGQATLVPPSLFEGFDYVALGHLHRPQPVGPRAHYSGSLLAYSFSEASDEKGVLSVEVSAGRAPVPTRRALRTLRPLRTLTGTFAELLEAPHYDAFRDDYLSITLTHAQRTGQPMAMLRRRFPRLLQLDNPVLQEDTGAARARQQLAAGGALGSDLAADLRAFEATLYGEQPRAEVLEAFEALHRELEAER